MNSWGRRGEGRREGGEGVNNLKKLEVHSVAQMGPCSSFIVQLSRVEFPFYTKIVASLERDNGQWN
jgi:hypothetical protein